MPPNELVLDAATRQLAGPLVVTETVGGHAIAVSLADSSTTRRMVLGVETPLVGREGELATLRAQLRRALDDEEREIVVVTGPSGIGKSRLVSEIRGDLEREAALVLEGRAAAAVRRAPAGLIAEAIARGAGVRAGQPTGEQWRALRQFLSRHASGLDDDDVTFLGVAIGLEAKDSLQLQAAKADPKLMQEHVSGALVAFLERAAERGPVAVWLEDLHWEHPPNLPLFSRVLEALDESPVFVVATARDELFEAHPGLFDELEPTRIALKPLGKRGVRRLAAAILQGEVSSELEASIRKWSDGNPYLLEEFLSWLVSRDAVIAKTAEWVFTQAPEALGLPVTLEAALQGRIDALGAERKEILKIAAVFGTSVWDAGIQALRPRPPPRIWPAWSRRTSWSPRRTRASSAPASGRSGTTRCSAWPTG
ncbi:MAG: AAA family ATPase [Sandaracinaceae bacterium]|nr:AAA family ATPase [Sandaracinaceae bacterium]